MLHARTYTIRLALVLRLTDVRTGSRRGKLQRTVYFWVGAQAASDKASVASIKAMELRKMHGALLSYQTLYPFLVVVR